MRIPVLFLLLFLSCSCQLSNNDCVPHDVNCNPAAVFLLSLTKSEGTYRDALGIEDSLMAYWYLDEQSTGITAADQINNLGGTYTATAGTGHSGAFDGSGTAVYFNGVDGWLNIPHDSIMNFEASDPWTIELWIKPDATQVDFSGTSNRVFSKWIGGIQYPFSLRFNNQTAGKPGTISCSLYDGTTAVVVTTNNRLDDGNFHHLVCTKDASFVTIYLDGTLESAVANTIAGNATSNSNNLVFGIQSNLATLPFNGALDEVSIYRTALPAQIVNSHYQIATNNK